MRRNGLVLLGPLARPIPLACQGCEQTFFCPDFPSSCGQPIILVTYSMDNRSVRASDEEVEEITSPASACVVKCMTQQNRRDHHKNGGLEAISTDFSQLRSRWLQGVFATFLFAASSGFNSREEGNRWMIGWSLPEFAAAPSQVLPHTGQSARSSHKQICTQHSDRRSSTAVEPGYCGHLCFTEPGCRQAPDY